MKGVVRELDAKVATIALDDGIEGQLRAREISRDRVEDARTVLKVGDEVEAKFTGLDRKSRGHFALDQGEGRPRRAAGDGELPDRIGAHTGTTLGELLKEQMTPRHGLPSERPAKRPVHACMGSQNSMTKSELIESSPAVRSTCRPKTSSWRSSTCWSS